MEVLQGQLTSVGPNANRGRGENPLEEEPYQEYETTF